MRDFGSPQFQPVPCQLNKGYIVASIFRWTIYKVRRNIRPDKSGRYKRNTSLFMLHSTGDESMEQIHTKM